MIFTKEVSVKDNYLMVIGFDASRAFGEVRTGTENYSYQLLKALSKIDQKNQYLIYTRSLTDHISSMIIELMKLSKNFKVVEIPRKRFWTQGGLTLQTFKDNLDVLFVPAHTLPLIRKPGLKTVVTVHDLGSEYLPAMHQLKQRLYLSFMQKYQLKTATKIIAVSNATKKDLVKRIGINPKKVSVIYEGYDNKLFKPHHNLQPKTYYLFVGTVQPRKNLERLIKAFSRYVARGPASSVSRRASSLTSFAAATRREPSSLSPLATTLVIAGSKGWLSDEIYKLPKELGIEERVKFLGYVQDKNLPALYSGAIALVFPSLFEGFGLPILEAQACGCPVITSNVSSMPEVAGKGAILVDPCDIDAISHAMIRVKGKAEREKLMKNGFENIKRFSWEKCAAQTLEVLEKT